MITQIRFILKHFPHTGHWYGLSSECAATWFIKLDFLLNDLPRKLQVRTPSSASIPLWLQRFHLCLKHLPHTVHSYGLSSEWVSSKVACELWFASKWFTTQCTKMWFVLGVQSSVPLDLTCIWRNFHILCRDGIYLASAMLGEQSNCTCNMFSFG